MVDRFNRGKNRLGVALKRNLSTDWFIVKVVVGCSERFDDDSGAVMPMDESVVAPNLDVIVVDGWGVIDAMWLVI
jgi:hypothetical protein